MTGAEYELVLGTKFVEDLQRLAADARRDPTQRAAYLRKQVLAEIKALTEGASDGHHALGYGVGKGDLRDCVTCYLRSDWTGSGIGSRGSSGVRPIGRRSWIPSERLLKRGPASSHCRLLAYCEARPSPLAPSPRVSGLLHGVTP